LSAILRRRKARNFGGADASQGPAIDHAGDYGHDRSPHAVIRPVRGAADRRLLPVIAMAEVSPNSSRGALADTPLTRQRPGTRAIGLAVAVGAHVALFTALVLSVTVPRLIEPPAIQVSLVPAFPLQAKPRLGRPPPPRTERTIAPRLGKLVGPAPIPPLPIPAAPPDAVTRERLLSAPFAPHEPVREGLRTSGGCTDADFLKLSPAERDKCRQRNHDLGAGAPTYAVGPSDPRKRAYLDKQAARNEAHRLRMEAPPSPPMAGCEDNRMSNLGFSCSRADGDAHLKF
jgi:hypothetical protein